MLWPLPQDTLVPPTLPLIPQTSSPPPSGPPPPCRRSSNSCRCRSSACRRCCRWVKRCSPAARASVSSATCSRRAEGLLDCSGDIKQTRMVGQERLCVEIMPPCLASPLRPTVRPNITREMQSHKNTSLNRPPPPPAPTCSTLRFHTSRLEGGSRSDCMRHTASSSPLSRCAGGGGGGGGAGRARGDGQANWQAGGRASRTASGALPRCKQPAFGPRRHPRAPAAAVLAAAALPRAQWGQWHASSAAGGGGGGGGGGDGSHGGESKGEGASAACNQPRWRCRPHHCVATDRHDQAAKASAHGRHPPSALPPHLLCRLQPLQPRPDGQDQLLGLRVYCRQVPHRFSLPGDSPDANQSVSAGTGSKTDRGVVSLPPPPLAACQLLAPCSERAANLPLCR